MPLYTYVLTYKGASYVTQDRRSNFNGFISIWSRDLPEGALPALTPSLKKELSKKAYHGVFDAVQNRKGVWKKTIDIGNSPFVVYAIQTET